MKYQRPRGTRDIWGVELERMEMINQKARVFFKQSGFSEMKTPTFEILELFARSIGAYTDIVEKEMFTFEHDRKVFVLRPEGTAPIIRAVIENKIDLPVRLFYIGQMFRKERPQKGRYREFQQIGIELIGEAEPFFDAEVIDLGRRFLKSIGLENFFIVINSIGCPLCRADYKKILDHYLMEKIDYLCPDCKRRYEKNFLRIFDCKNKTCQEIYLGAPKISEHLCADCRLHYEKTKDYLKRLGNEYIEDRMLVRGLDYYTRMVFEFKLTGLGAQDTIVAGGRYDLLMKELGGNDIPCIGWAMGVDRTLLALPVDLPRIEKKKIFFVAIMDEQFIGEIVKLKKMIENSGNVCIAGNPLDSIKRQMKDANHYNSDYVVIYGEDEAAEDVYSIKDMSSGVQIKIRRSEIEIFLKNPVI